MENGNGMPPRPFVWWREISRFDVLRIIGTILLEFLKLASAKASIAAELNKEITKNRLELDGSTRDYDVKEYEADDLMSSIVFFVIEGIFMLMLIKSLIPVAPTRVLYEEIANLKKRIENLEKDGAYHLQIWREAKTYIDKLKAQKNDLEKRALDAEQNLAQALLELKAARDEAVNAQQQVLANALFTTKGNQVIADPANKEGSGGAPGDSEEGKI